MLKAVSIKGKLHSFFWKWAHFTTPPELNSRVLPFSNPLSQFSDFYMNISNLTVSGLIDFHSIYFFLLWKSMRPETGY